MASESTNDRARQIQRDGYYMDIARAVRSGANCSGTNVGAVAVVKNRVVSTGYNGTPEGFLNCRDGGCLRCSDSVLDKQNRGHEMSDETHVSGRALDRCICVHAEQNAFMTAARFGIPLDGATLYTTSSPCMGCLKELVQAGIERVVFGEWYEAKYSPALAQQYVQLYEQLMSGEPRNFEALGGGRPKIVDQAQPDAYADDSTDAVLLEPPVASESGAFEPDAP